QQIELSAPWNKRDVTINEDGSATMEIVDDFGRYEIASHGLIHHGAGRESYEIKKDDPLSAVMKTHWTEERARGDWSIRTETYGELRANATHWLVKGRLEAYEGEKLIFSRDWNEEIERKLN
ncbi:MAG: peptidase S15, partial [Rhizobiales bacterium]|nr:peptidase S15 [Hyphomicrobiales bacterium]